MHVRVDGAWLHAIAPWGDLSWSHSWPGGCKDASFGAYFKPGERHPALTRGALLEVMDGPSAVWSGTLDELDWRAGEFKALGLVYDADDYPCIDGAGNATAVLATAVDQAIVDGWQVSRGSSISLTPYVDAAEGLNSVAALAASQSDELGQRFAVRADRVVVMEADPTTPTWHISPGVVDLGLASDDYASTIVVRYQTTTGPYATSKRTDAAAAARFGPKFMGVNATVLGPISAARADAIGDGHLTKGRARLSWTSAVDISPNELLTAGGSPAPLEMVVAGQMVRIHGIYDDLSYLAGRTHLDVVIGETSYVAGAQTIRLAPVGTAAEDFAGITEEIYAMTANVA